MANMDIIRRITIQLEEQGFAEVAARFRAVTQAGGDLKKAADDVNKALNVDPRPLTSLERPIAVLQRRFVEGAKEAHELARAMKVVQDYSASGGDRAVANRILEGITRQTQAYREQQAAIEAAGEAEQRRLVRSAAGPQVSHIEAFRSAMLERARQEAEIENEARARAAQEAAAARQRQLTRDSAGPQTGHIELFRADQARKAAEEAERVVAQFQRIRDMMRQANPADAHVVQFRAMQQELADREKQAEEVTAALRRMRDMARQIDPPTSHVAAYREHLKAVQAAADETERLTAASSRYVAEAMPLEHVQKRVAATINDIRNAQLQRIITDEQATAAIAHQHDLLRRVEHDYGGLRGSTIAMRTQLAYQANDIVSGLAMGQSPLTILTQQGGQVYQAFADAPGGAAAGIKEFGTSVGRWLLTPMGGVTLALGAAATAAALFYSRVTRGSVDAATALQNHTDLAGRLKEHYEGAADAMARASQQSRTVLQAQLAQTREQLSSNLGPGGNNAIGNVLGGAQYLERMGLPLDLIGRMSTEPVRSFRGAIEELRASITAGNPDIIRFREAVANIASNTNNQAVRDMARELLRTTEETERLQRAAQGLESVLLNSARAAREMATATAATAPAVQAYQNRTTQSGRTGYGANVYDINRYYDAQRTQNQGVRSEAALDSIEAARQRALDDVNRLFLQGASGYSRGVADAPEQFRQLYLQAGARHGVDPNLLAAQGYQESRWKPNAYNTRSGAAGIAQFMPGTAQQYGLSNPYDPAQAIDAQARMMRELIDRFGGDISKALAGYNWGPNRATIRAGDVANYPRETQNYIGAIMRPGQSPEDQVRNQYEYNRALEETRTQLQSQRDLIGQNAAEQARLQYIQQQEAEFRSRNKEMTAEERAEVERLAAAHAEVVRAQATGELTQQLDEQNRRIEFQRTLVGRTAEEQARMTAVFEMQERLRRQGVTATEAQIEATRRLAANEQIVQRTLAEQQMQRDLNFERDQIGRSSEEQGIASRLRSVYGENYTQHMDGMLAQQMRFNAALRQTKDLASEALSGFVSDLRNGMSAGDAFSNVLDRIADKITQMALDSAINGMFGGGTGNAFMTMLSSVFGGGAANSNTPGYFGSSAGPASLAFGGPKAGGGPVYKGLAYMVGERRPELFIPSADGYIHPQVPQAGNGNVNIQVVNNGTPQEVVSRREESDGRGGRRVVMVTRDMVADGIASPQGQRAARTANARPRY